MPDFNGVLKALNIRVPNFKDAEALEKALEEFRKEYLGKLHLKTGRNIIIYYSGFLQNPGTSLKGAIEINEHDKNGFMAAIHGLDTSKGLDLILHTPGGDTAATESLIDYLVKKFDNIRVIVPQMAMSGGTMIACAGDKIVMGKQSSLGPIDPNIGGRSAHGILEEFDRALAAVKKDPVYVGLWASIISQYSPTLLGECEKAIRWSEEITKEALLRRMLKNDKNKDQLVANILKELGDHSVTLSHSRRLSVRKMQGHRFEGGVP